MAKVTKRKTSFGTSMGVTSIIAILVILVLVVFSTLSVTTSKADLTLSKKTADSITAFYEADSKAEELLANIASTIAGDTNWQETLSTGGYEVAPGPNGNTLVSYVVEIDVNRNLNIVISVLPDKKLSKQLWQITPANEWVADGSINLFR